MGSCSYRILHRLFLQCNHSMVTAFLFRIVHNTFTLDVLQQWLEYWKLLWRYVTFVRIHDTILRCCPTFHVITHKKIMDNGSIWSFMAIATVFQVHWASGRFILNGAINPNTRCIPPQVGLVPVINCIECLECCLTTNAPLISSACYASYIIVRRITLGPDNAFNGQGRLWLE